MKTKLALVLASLLGFQALAVEPELSGKLGIESRTFFHQPQWSEQDDGTNGSFFIEPELYWTWNGDNDAVTFKPYVRIDEVDSERSHLDIRELAWTHVGDDWEIHSGIRKIYWGVTEFQHLVDVINQTDGVEDIDGEDKLGQAMVNLSLVKDWGILDLYVLPGFRERTFAGENGRLRSEMRVNTDKVSYQSGLGQDHIDYAVRWAHSIGDFDVGSYWFHGTDREPILAPFLHGKTDEVELRPYYQQMDQFGIDVQATLGDWLWKFETIYRDTDQQSFTASQLGFEHSTVSLLGSNIDLGLLMEFGWDSRGEQLGVSGQKDLFVGARLAFNDAQSTELLIGGGTDLDHNAYSVLLEASRRLAESYKLSVDLRYFSAKDLDVMSGVTADDHIQITLEKYF